MPVPSYKGKPWKVVSPVPMIAATAEDVLAAMSSDTGFVAPSIVTDSSPTVSAGLSAVINTVLGPVEADEIVLPLFELPDTFDLSFVNQKGLGGLTPDRVFIHPAVIRAAARRGSVFYVGADKKGHRQTLNREEAKDLKEVKAEAPGSVIDPSFYWTPPWLPDLKSFLKRDETVMLIGPAGCGKTEGTEQVFKERNQQLHIVSCTPSMTADDMEGRIDLVAGETKFTYATPAVAVQSGHGLLLDEADACPAETLFALYRILTRKDMHIIRLGGPGVVPRHKDFRVVGTQNTQGRGDDRGLHHGRAYQDEAFLDRWDQAIQVDYPEPEHEVLILRKRTGLSAPAAGKVVEVAKALRKALVQDEVMFVCSIRRTLSVAANLQASMTPERAWQFSVLNRVTTEDQVKIREVLQRIYGDRLRKPNLV